MKMSDNDDEEVENVYVPSPKVKEHRVTKQNVLQTVDVVQVVKHHQVVMIKISIKEKGKRDNVEERKKKQIILILNLLLLSAMVIVIVLV